jgi:hypothetical protein
MTSFLKATTNLNEQIKSFTTDTQMNDGMVWYRRGGTTAVQKNSGLIHDTYKLLTSFISEAHVPGIRETYYLACTQENIPSFSSALQIKESEDVSRYSPSFSLRAIIKLKPCRYHHLVPIS